MFKQKANVEPKFKVYEGTERHGDLVWILLKPEELSEALRGNYTPPNLVRKKEVHSCGHTRECVVFSRGTKPVIKFTKIGRARNAKGKGV